MWWATDSLQDSDFHPGDWQAVTDKKYSASKIEASHMDILKNTQWQQQLQTQLQTSLSDVNSTTQKENS